MERMRIPCSRHRGGNVDCFVHELQAWAPCGTYGDEFVGEYQANLLQVMESCDHVGDASSDYTYVAL